MVSRASLTGLVPLAVLALVLAACETDDDAPDPDPVEDPADDPADEADDPADDAADEADDPAADDAAVTVVDFTYDPDPIEVAAGATIEWTNEDGVPHTVTAGEPGEPTEEFDESLDGSGGTASITFDEPGTYAYFCTLHPNMVGEVVVE